MDPTNLQMLYHSDFLYARSVSDESLARKPIWWALAVIESFLFIRLILEYFAVNTTSFLANGVYALTEYILYPFTYTLANVGEYVNSSWITLFAIIGYFLLTVSLIIFFKTIRSPRSRIERARTLSRKKYSL